ncbi:sensor histidine kinase [Actinoallomurus rhizosphaericola]|uniref:sensor histidine kinase n=1 Tax=Actinoallomurus rhizosphaericola TaxID=2952536 RepID=UPI002093FB19|nr:sensor histidine kinase [Actinoallomurus rhizosphaericola]MCO5997117.1 sensor histidine kinase [Actinoallomurus rhizosphaericola]
MSELIRGRRAWLEAHPITADAFMAVLLTVAYLAAVVLQGGNGAPKGPDVFSVVLSGVALVALTVRRRLPVGVLAFVMTVCGTLTAMGYDVSAPAVAMLIATYTVAAHRGMATSLPVGALTLMLFIGLLVAAGADFWPAVSNTVLVVGVWWLGRSLRLRRAYLNELEARARRLERAREADARAARTEERSRIARELHDVVAHHVSVMTVQAGAARRILERDPDAVRDALSTIEQMGRTALGEMRRLVGVLRTEAEPVRGELSPQPGVNDVGELVDHLRETGLQVQLWIEGESRNLSPGVDLAAFRLIQEALTNTLKHAGPQARAWVRIHYADRQLMVEVEDDGRGLAAGLGQNGSRGHGLVGMRERVALYGGDLRIGPRSGGGFEVRARFPLEV